MPVRTLSWAVRSSGRDVKAVRRPVATPLLPQVDATLKKADLVALAEERGLDTTGTKADLVERLTTPEANDATVDVSDG